MELYWVQGYKFTWLVGMGLVRRSSSLGVELKSELTVDASLGFAIVQVDVHLGVPKSTAATITGNLGRIPSV